MSKTHYNLQQNLSGFDQQLNSVHQTTGFCCWFLCNKWPIHHWIIWLSGNYRLKLDVNLPFQLLARIKPQDKTNNHFAFQLFAACYSRFITTSWPAVPAPSSHGSSSTQLPYQSLKLHKTCKLDYIILCPCQSQKCLHIVDSIFVS